MRKLLAPVIALGVALVTAGIVLAWSQPVLTAECAEDASHYEWKINLPTEADYNIDWSFDSGFATFTHHDFVTAGNHEFLTAQGGPILYVRWSSDHSVKTQADANAELCTPPSVEQSIAASVEQSIAASVEESIAAPPVQTVEAGTGTPAASVPNTSLNGNGSSPLPTVIFSMVLLASLGTLAYTNVKVARAPHRNR